MTSNLNNNQMDAPSPDLLPIILRAMAKATATLYSAAKGPAKRRLELLRSEYHARKIAGYAERIDAIKTNGTYLTASAGST